MAPGTLEVVTAVVAVLLCMGLGVAHRDVPGLHHRLPGRAAFIATLGGMFIFKSGILLVTKGKSLFISSNDTYKYIAQGLLPPAVGYLLAALVAIVLFALCSPAGRASRIRHRAPPLGLDLAKAGFFSLICRLRAGGQPVFDPAADQASAACPSWWCSSASSAC